MSGSTAAIIAEMQNAFALNIGKETTQESEALDKTLESWGVTMQKDLAIDASGVLSGSFTSPTNLSTPGTHLVIVSDGKGNAAIALFTLT